METQEIDQTTAAAAPAAAQPAKQDKLPEPGSRAEHIRAALELLYARFPKAFIKEGDARPLKVGILEDLKKEVPNLEGMTMSKLRAAVRLYCTRLRYLYSVREGVMRIDLEGNEVEAVTAEHGKYAKERFEEINEERKKRLEEEKNKPKGADGKPQGKRPFNKGGKKPFNKFAGKKPGFNKRPRPPMQGTGTAPAASGDAAAAPHATRKPMVRVSPAAHVRRGMGMGSRSFGVPATAADLKLGTSVLVLNNNHYMKGTVSAEPDQGTVKVQLSTGITMALPIERVLLPNRPSARSAAK